MSGFMGRAEGGRKEEPYVRAMPTTWELGSDRQGTKPNSESLSFLICKIGMVIPGLEGCPED